MTTPFWCLFAAVLMPILLSFVGGYFRTQQFEKADNNNPRAQAVQLEGAGARAYAAQANAWEALSMFAPAVIVAHLAGVPESAAAPFAIAFVVFRVLHAVLYLADQATLRSVAFLGGLACVITLFVKAA